MQNTTAVDCSDSIFNHMHQMVLTTQDWDMCNHLLLIVNFLTVCLSVRKHISRTTHTILPNFLCMLPMAVARSSSGIVAINCVLLVCG